METTKLNWQMWLDHGDKYLSGATPKGEKSRFGADIRYNVLSMAFESFAMAMLDFHHQLPENHTYTDLVTALDRVIPLEEGLRARILSYESIQSICSIDKYHRSSPTEAELTDLHAAIVEVSEMAHRVCAGPLIPDRV